jgi:3-hydroxy-9,10-secoandrosta-1,3,5(10)-triene-9,17-dione monooxygenase reductase component
VNPQAAPTARSVAPESFREALGRWATGVALVTADVGGRPEGLIVNSFTAVSLEPPLVSFSPSRLSLTWGRMRTAKRFGVNVLGAGYESFARHAARPGADRFAGIAWSPTVSGVPAMTDAVAFLECTVQATYPAGDHWIVVGRVEGLRARTVRTPLVFWGRQYWTL